MSEKDHTATPPLIGLGDLRNNLGYLSRILRSVVQQSSGDFTAELGFAAGQMTMLGLIAANPEITQNDLSRVMHMKKSQVTALVHDLVARHLVTRETHGTDRRFNTLKLTRAGNQLWRKVDTRMSDHSDFLLEPLPQNEQEQLTALLRKLLKAHLNGVGIDFS